MTVQTPQPVTVSTHPCAGYGCAANHSEARRRKKQFLFWGRSACDHLHKHARPRDQALAPSARSQIDMSIWNKDAMASVEGSKAPRPGGHTHTRLIVRNRHHIEVREEFQSLTPAQQRELASLLASLQQLAFLGRVSLTLYCVWGPSVAKVFTTDAALRPSRPKPEHPNSNVPPQHLSTLIIFMLQGRRLQLPSASFLVCKSSSRNHSRASGVIAHPASDTLARCTRSPIFSLPSPSWSAQQEGAEV